MSTGIGAKQNGEQQITADYEFFENIILYAKWSPKDEGYYVYFMDFDGTVRCSVQDILDGNVTWTPLYSAPIEEE